MCRFIVYWGNKPTRLSDWILKSSNCLLEQSRHDRSHRPNPDGWGFTFREGEKLVLKKNSRPAFEDEEFRTAAKGIVTDLLFAHVRRKSQGTISLENTHPFVHEQWLFMHNGNIPNFEFYKNQLSSRLPRNSIINTEGTTDSEYLFKYFIYWFRQKINCDIYCILNIIYSIIHELIDLTDEDTRADLALNFMLSNGKFVLGFRRNRTLYYQCSENSVIIASEIIGPVENWNEVPENHFIVATAPDHVQLAAYNIELKQESFSITT
ncbi:MAG: class II glutamine amidotransferase [Calditrichaeota bacterium]|nr:class II glutamine amidotransferase [Calditrichota bacterium]RQV98436.1 MAG: class II glutamine amidotransferase [Calditrichota bacterium]